MVSVVTSYLIAPQPGKEARTQWAALANEQIGSLQKQWQTTSFHPGKIMTYTSLLAPDRIVFDKPCLALEDTDWVSDPINPMESSTGPISKGDRVWLHRAHLGSGPAWQPARLANGTLCYVNPSHFDFLRD